MMARYASYEDLTHVIRARFVDAPATLRELFARLVFNVLVGNTDDHAKNHAAFWDGESLTVTPAYDICPQPRTGGEASQAMLVCGFQRQSRLAVCQEAAPSFLLRSDEALEIARAQVASICEHWRPVCDEAGLTEVDREFMWRRQFLNPLAFQASEQHFVDVLP